jgi:hypothetical protein
MKTHPVIRIGATTTTGLGLVIAAFLAVVVAIFAIIGVLTHQLGDLDASTWQTAGAGAFKYFTLAIGIMITPVYLPVLVAQGLTRHYVALGGAVFIGCWSAVMAMAMWLGYAAERALYGVAGVTQEFDTPHLFTQWSEFHLVFAEYFLLIAVHMAVGWLIGTTYYRFGWFLATLLIPLVIVPAAVVEVLLATSWVGAGLDEFTTYAPPALAIAIPAALLAIAAAWAINYALIRTITITLKDA